MENTGIVSFNKLLSNPAVDTAKAIAESIREGNADAVQAGIALKKFNKLYSLFFDSQYNKEFKDVKDIIETEILRYKEGTAKTFTIYGTKITEANRGYWDYSQTEDPMLSALKDIEEEVKKRIKLREEYLQSKVAEYNLNNSPGNIMQFGIKPFKITVEELPVFTMEEAFAEITTNPPIKKEISSLRFSV